LGQEHVGSFLLVCKQFAKQRYELVVRFIPNLYARQNVAYNQAFFPCDHPQWTPEKLPSEIRWKLHTWYLEGQRMKLPDSQDWSEEDKVRIRRKWRLLYSAACLGHQLAAQEAGTMLLDRRLNDIVPLVTTFADLEPEVVEYDIRRLNRPQSQNEQLAEIMDKVKIGIEEDGEEQDEQTRRLAMVKRLKAALCELGKIDLTMEVKVVNMCLSEYIPFLEQGGHPDNFVPTQATIFARAQRLSSPMINGMLFSLEQDDNVTPSSAEACRVNYLNTLNYDFVQSYCEALEPQYSTKAPHPDKPNSFIFHVFNTPEARKVLEKVINLRTIALLLGERDIAFIPSLASSYIDDPEALNRVFVEIKPTEDRIRTFLWHLLLTRQPTHAQFEAIKDLLVFVLAAPGLDEQYALNPVRFKKLVERFESKKEVIAQSQQQR
jgi:hypothetical protein